MKKYLLFSCLSIFVFKANAQVSIQPVLPLAGIIQKSSLWNIAVINTSPVSFDCRIELTLRNRTSGLEVLTATTGQFIIASGAKQLNASSLMPIQYNYFSTLRTVGTDELIPIGDYTACYRLIPNGKNLIAEECVSFDVEPLSPPSLITPADSTVQPTAPTQFNWIHPAPFNLFNRLQYELVITEILPGQKAEEAVQQNLPFYTEANLPVNNMTYRGAAVSFEKDKWYAWQVTARDDNSYAGKSEVWVFSVQEDKQAIVPPGDIYLMLGNDAAGGYVLTGRTLHIKYLSFLKMHNAKIIFSDVKGNTIHTAEKKINQGENYLDFELNNQFKTGTVYKVSIADSQNKVHTLSFSLNK